jgi:hypothetical protein
MKTDPERYSERHRKFMRRVEEEFEEHRRTNPAFTVSDAITGLAARVRLAIARRDAVSGILAAQCCHLALNVKKGRREDDPFSISPHHALPCLPCLALPSE